MHSFTQKFWKYKLDHVLFWLFTVLFFVYTKLYLINKAGLDQFIIEILLRNTLLAVIVYAALSYGLNFLKIKKYIAFVFLVTGLVLFFTVTKSFHDNYLYGNVLHDKTRAGFWPNAYYNFSIAVFYIGFAMALQFSKEWFQQRDNFQKLKIENLNSELNYLKAQLNPHFLFNSLNTLYVQIDETNADAKKTLEKISGMLRYQLYECNNEKISIEKELAYIKNYIELQKLRKEESFNINFSYDTAVKNFDIAPLLFIPFIENAFKHLSAYKNNFNKVEVNIKKINSKVILYVFNTTTINSEAKEGIGLINVKRRLELLYENNYSLLIDKQPSTFSVTLSINVS